MRIKILSAAESDLEEGHRFYETQADGLGNYFLDTRKEASKNSEFAQMQGAEKISAAPHMVYMQARNFLCNAAVGMKCGFLRFPLLRY